MTCRNSHTGVDVFTRAEFLYSNAVATATAAIGAKQEGDLCITGTEGYIYVPAPWWKTEMFEVRFEDSRLNRKYLPILKGTGCVMSSACFAPDSRLSSWQPSFDP